MGLFSPFKSRANEFKYEPRYYDPKKEQREQRRRELRSESSADAGREYQPGQYIRTQSEARRERFAQRYSKKRGTSTIVLVLGILLALVVAYMLAPRLASVMTEASTPRTRDYVEEEGFDPYAPIRIVPNDYNGE